MMSEDFKHAKITGQDMRDHWGPIVDRIADEISDLRDARIAELEAQIAAMRAAGDRLAGFSEHTIGCLVWEEVCTCGRNDALKAWQEARGDD